MQIAIELEDVQLLIVLKFLNAVFRNFDHGTENFGGALAYGQLEIVDHELLLLGSGENRNRGPQTVEMRRMAGQAGIGPNVSLIGCISSRPLYNQGS